MKHIWISISCDIHEHICKRLTPHEQITLFSLSCTCSAAMGPAQLSSANSVASVPVTVNTTSTTTSSAANTTATAIQASSHTTATTAAGTSSQPQPVAKKPLNLVAGQTSFISEKSASGSEKTTNKPAIVVVSYAHAIVVLIT